MGADEFPERDLLAEIESGHQAIVSPATSNLTCLRFGTLAFGAAFWTASVEPHCAALTSVCQR
jgi:hypothetical protein